MSLINRTGLNGEEDFLGFTFNGVHSSEYRIIRVTGGNRINDSLLPEIKSKTINIEGLDGELWLKNNISTKKFSIDFAYDDLREDNIRDLRNWLSPNTEGELIFDEAPYKAYRVVIEKSPTLSYICFDEKIDNDDNDEPLVKRVYKGEGKIEFIAYYPYATNPLDESGSRRKWLDHYHESEEEEPFQWEKASGLVWNDGYDIWYSDPDSYIKVNNTGDLPTYLNFDITLQGELTIWLDDFNYFTLISDEERNIFIDGKLRLIYDKNTGEILNYLMIDGDFFMLPLDESYLWVDRGSSGSYSVSVDYKFLYY